MGRLLMIAGAVLLGAGLAVTFLERFSIPLGRLPGDIVWRGKNTTVFFPVVTCLLLSLLLSGVLWLMNRR